MKKVLLFAFVLGLGLSAYAQMKPVSLPEHLQKISAVRSDAMVHETNNFTAAVNPSVAPVLPKGINETVIATTRYDLQTNQSCQNRVYLFPDGTIGGTCTWGMTESAFADRGTGYNYHDGSAWGTNPTARLESTRNGWPSYNPWGAGEVVVSHNGSTGLLVSTRATKGTGTWTTNVLVGPTTSGGTTALLWPRTIVTNGDDIHIIACTDQAEAPQVYYYNGLALALVYIRSTDGGATWDAPLILPGMDSATIASNVNRGFSGDAYSWAAPKGDTIAFVVGDSWQDVFVMKSFDNGANWVKIPVFDFPNIVAFPTPRIPSTDGCYSIALDSDGDAHVTMGKMFVSKKTSNMDSSSYYPYTDALVYWNESMPPIDTLNMSRNDSLFNHGQFLAMMIDYNGNDSIDFPPAPAGEWPFGTYYNSLSSYPSMIITPDDSIFVAYSSCHEDKIDATGTKLYRDIYIMKGDGSNWTDATNLSASVIHDFDESICPSVSFTADNRIHLVYQADELPGLAIRGDETAFTDNSIYYVNILRGDIGFIGMEENTTGLVGNMNVYPNPSSDYTYIDLNLASASKVSVDVTNMVGQTIISRDLGQMSSGDHTVAFGISQLQPGIYFFTVRAGADMVTKKIIVQ